MKFYDVDAILNINVAVNSGKFVITIDNDASDTTTQKKTIKVEYKGLNITESEIDVLTIKDHIAFTNSTYDFDEDVILTVTYTDDTFTTEVSQT
jgi:hypothetical protein